MLTERTAEERQVQETYQHLLAHLDRCGPCQEWADCEEGERIRRALRAARAAALAATDADVSAAPTDSA